jgi:hypothetical protein
LPSPSAVGVLPSLSPSSEVGDDELELELLPPPPHAANATAEIAASAAIRRKNENFFKTRPPKI